MQPIDTEPGGERNSRLRHGRPVLIGLGAGAFGVGLFLAAGSTLLAYLATHPLRKEISQTPEQFGATYSEIRFPSRDGVVLEGWFVPAPDTPRGAIVLCHGMSANREEMLPWAERLWQEGFSLLLDHMVETAIHATVARIDSELQQLHPDLG